MKTNVSKFCTPAKLYFAIAVLGSVMALLQRVPLMPVAVKMGFAFLWAMFLNYLCAKGYASVSWFLVVVPYVLIMLGVLGFMRMAKQKKKCNK